MTEIQNKFMTFEFLKLFRVSDFVLRISKINMLIFAVDSSQIVAQNFMGATTVK
jgi:hypothetical protein